MSQITLSANASGIAIFTVAAPGTGTNQTLTLPNATATLVGDSATQTLTNKSIAAGQLTGSIAATQMNSTGSAPVYGCRAWAAFDGTTIAASGNVSSISNPSTGAYTVNFTTAMQDANYALSLTAATSGGGTAVMQFTNITKSTSSFSFNLRDQNGSLVTRDNMSILVFR